MDDVKINIPNRTVAKIGVPDGNTVSAADYLDGVGQGDIDKGINVVKYIAPTNADKAKIGKELRAVTARHEISGEAGEFLKAREELPGIVERVSNGRVPAKDTINAHAQFVKDNTRFASHYGPGVLNGDIKMTKRMSPLTKRYEGIMRGLSSSGRPSVMEGADPNTMISELDAMNELRQVAGLPTAKRWQDFKPMNAEENGKDQQSQRHDVG